MEGVETTSENLKTGTRFKRRNDTRFKGIITLTSSWSHCSQGQVSAPPGTHQLPLGNPVNGGMPCEEVRHRSRDWIRLKGLIWYTNYTSMKLRAEPSRYHALDQPGRSILHRWASAKALSPSRMRSQQRLRLANRVASSGSISITYICMWSASHDFSMQSNRLSEAHCCIFISFNVRKAQISSRQTWAKKGVADDVSTLKEM